MLWWSQGLPLSLQVLLWWLQVLLRWLPELLWRSQGLPLSLQAPLWRWLEPHWW